MRICRMEMGVQLGSRLVILVTFVLCAFTLTTGALNCPRGWIKYAPGNTCIYLSPKGGNFAKAKKTCTSSKAKLVKIADSKMNTFIQGKIKAKKSSYYIGLNDAVKEGTFVWNNEKTQPKYKNWVKNEPNNYRGKEDCVLIRYSDGKWNDSPCSQYRRFICQKAPVPPPPKPTVKCPSGWVAYETGKTCFLFTTRAVNKNTARKSCKNQGGDLAKIPNKATSDFITKTIKAKRLNSKTFYIGLHDTTQENRFRWNDERTKASFTNWNKKEPNDYGKGEDCTVINPNSKWNDVSCIGKRPYICQKPPDNCDLGWEEDFNSPYCYQINSRSKVNYATADKKCKALGASLTSVLSSEEQTFLTARSLSHKISGFLWLGANDRKTEGGVVWTDSKPLAFVNWDGDQPNYKNNQDCVGMKASTGKWSDLSCNLKYGYICKKTGRKPIPTIAPTTSPKTTPAKKKYGCPPGTSTYKNSCYSIFYWKSGGVTWSDARVLCQKNKGDLVSISDGAENKFVYSIIPKSYKYQMWIGMSDTIKESTFLWSDNSPVTYTNWNRRQPGSVRKSDCVMMNTRNGRWSVHHCTEALKKLVMCKQSKKVLSIISTSLQDGCSQGSLGYGASCYSFPSDVLKFTAAEAACKKQNGHLATIHDNHVQSFLAPEMAKYVGYARWIGLSSTKATGGAYTWTSGASLGYYTNWARGHTGKENNTCIAMQVYSPVGLWRDYDCSESTLPYICEFSRKGYTTPTTVTTTVAQIACPTGWYTLDNMCYKAMGNGINVTTWREARDTCASLADRGNLVTISGLKISNFLYRQISGDKLDTSIDYWIGLSDLSTENGFKWADGSPFFYKRWGYNEPNDHADSEDCVSWSLKNSYSRWNDANCNTAKNYICQMPRGAALFTPPPTVDVGNTDAAMCGTKGDWHYHDKHCYWAVFDGHQASWFDAQKFCRLAKSELVSIGSDAENTFVLSLASKHKSNGIWIGLSDFDNGVYKWTDRSAFRYQAWGPNEPNDFGGSERCTEMDVYTGKWNDRHCSDVRNYMCKYRKGIAQPLTTTVPQGGCPPGYTTHPKASHCFILYGEGPRGATYDKAAQFCKVWNGGSLATIKNQYEQDVILTLMVGMNNSIAWLGLSSRNDKNEYEWFDNRPADYVNWKAGYPRPLSSSRTKDCVAVLSGRNGDAGSWINVPCTNQAPYICQVQKTINAPPPIPNTMGCNPGYQRYGNSCYKFVNAPLTWDQAEKMCVGEQGHMISITNRYEAAFFNLLTADRVSDVWIGLDYSWDTALYSWSDGWPVTYTQWGPNEPDAFHAWTKPCILANSSTSSWQSSGCGVKLPFVCEVNLGTSPPIGSRSVYGICPDGWTKRGDYCYYANTDVQQTRSWAAIHCQNEGGHLASILNQDENTFLINFVVNGVTTPLWLGLQRGVYSGYSWDDGSPVDFNVFKNSTAADNGPCVTFVNADKQWKKTNCFDKNGYICKKLRKGLTTTTTTTTWAPATTTAPTTTTKSPSVKHVTMPEFTIQTVISNKPRSRSTEKSFTRAPERTTRGTGDNHDHDHDHDHDNNQTGEQKGNDSGNAGGLSHGAVAGIVLGVIFVCLLAAVLVVMIRRGGMGSFGRAQNRTETPSVGFDNVMFSNSGDNQVSLS